MNLSLQLYTLRDLTARDFAATLRAVAGIGYRWVELAGFGNLKTAQEVKRACDDAGVKISSAHVPIEALESDLDAVIADHRTLGNQHIIVPFLSEARRGSDAGAWRTLATSLNAIGRKLADQGFTLAYHNHSFEFVKYDGTYALDVLWQHADPKLVGCEIDVYWVQHGGVDPATYIRQLGSRVRFVHLKDMDPLDANKFAPVGTGRLKFAEIVKAATEVGAVAGVAEQDNCYGADPLEVSRTCYENLKKFGV